MTETQKEHCARIIRAAAASAAAVQSGLALLPGSDAAVLGRIHLAMVVALNKVFEQKITDSAAKALLQNSDKMWFRTAATQISVGWIPVLGNAIYALTVSSATEALGWKLADELDRKLPTALAQDVIPATPPNATMTISHSGVKRILFVDDEDFFARPYITQLKDAGYDVALCQTADALLKNFLSNAPVDAIVLDIMVPPATGTSILDHPRDSLCGLPLVTMIAKVAETMKGLPIIVLTYSNPESVREQCREMPIPQALIMVRSKADTPVSYIPSLLAMAIKNASTCNTLDD